MAFAAAQCSNLNTRAADKHRTMAAQLCENALVVRAPKSQHADTLRRICEILMNGGRFSFQNVVRVAGAKVAAEGVGSGLELWGCGSDAIDPVCVQVPGGWKFTFKTNAHPPTKVAATVAQAAPELELCLSFASKSGGYVGSQLYRKGKAKEDDGYAIDSGYDDVWKLASETDRTVWPHPNSVRDLMRDSDSTGSDTDSDDEN